MKNIEEYVELMFKELPKTKKVDDIKNNIISTMEEKYNDLVIDGKTEQEALNIVFSQFGDIEELKREFELESENSNVFIKKTDDKSYTNSKVNNSSDKKLFNAEEVGKGDYKKLEWLYKIIMPSATIIYLLIGFITDIWHPTWIIFPLAALVTKGIIMINENTKNK